MSKYQGRIDESVVCPFYKWSNPNTICCEGIEKGTTLGNSFGSRTRLKEYMKSYCCDINNYSKCTICALLNRKYGG